MGAERRGQPQAVAAPHPGRGMMCSKNQKSESDADGLWLWNVEGGSRKRGAANLVGRKKTKGRDFRIYCGGAFSGLAIVGCFLLSGCLPWNQLEFVSATNGFLSVL
jgi:hypothetical protein